MRDTPLARLFLGRLRLPRFARRFFYFTVLIVIQVSAYAGWMPEGTPVVKLADTQDDPRVASDGADGTIVFASAFASGTGGSGLFRVSAAGGAPEQLTTPDAEQGEFAHSWPEILPGGEAVLFSVLRGPSVEDTEIAVLGIVKLSRIRLTDPQYPRFTTGPEPIILGVSPPSFR